MIFLRFRYSFLQKNMVLCVAEKRWYGMSESKETIGSLAVSPAPRFITIPAATQGQARKLRVAAYARVSSDSDDQLHSYAAQNAYFTKLIISNPDWDFVDVYNEKYEGNSLTQKTCTSKELSRRKRRNTGERRQILVTDDHTGIVSHEVFAKVQELLKRKRTAEPKKEGKDVPFKGKIVCGVCGASLRRKPVRGKMYWLCRTHEQAAADCPIKQVPEIEIEQAFLRLYFKLQHGGMNILTQLLQDIQEARSNRLLWSEDMVAINKQISDISGQERLLSQLRQQGAVDPDIFISRSNQLSEMRREAKQKKSRILRSEEDQTIQKTQEMMDILESGPDMLDALDEELFSELVERIVVESNNRICFQLINGMGATESIERIKR